MELIRIRPSGKKWIRVRNPDFRIRGWVPGEGEDDLQHLWHLQGGTGAPGRGGFFLQFWNTYLTFDPHFLKPLKWWDFPSFLQLKDVNIYALGQKNNWLKMEIKSHYSLHFSLYPTFSPRGRGAISIPLLQGIVIIISFIHCNIAVVEGRGGGPGRQGPDGGRQQVTVQSKYNFYIWFEEKNRNTEIPQNDYLWSFLNTTK